MGKAGGKAACKVVEKKLDTLGYRFARTNSHNWYVFTRNGFPDVTLNPSIAERDAIHLVKNLDRRHGIEHQTNKRNAQAIKERNRVERARIKAEMDRLDIERADLIRRHELEPTAAFDHLVRAQRLAIEREIQRIDRERHEWQRMMTQLDSAVVA